MSSFNSAKIIKSRRLSLVDSLYLLNFVASENPFQKKYFFYFGKMKGRKTLDWYTIKDRMAKYIIFSATMANCLLKNIMEKIVWRKCLYDSTFCLSPFRPGTETSVLPY
jgi:hypothetical protein